MAQTVKLKRSAVSGNTPTTSDLALGEIAINTYDGNIFIKKNDGTESIVTFSPGSNAGTIEEDSFSGNGSTTAFTLSTAPSSEEHLLVFIDATFQNRDSFTISGTTITFDTAPDNGSSVRVYHVIPGSVDDGVLTVAKFAADTLVLESEGISSNDNDTTIPTSAAVKDYVDTQVATVDTLPEVLANGNTTGGTDIAVSTGDDITFADSSKAIFGAGSDLQIYHDPNHGVINESGTGHLKIQGNEVRLQNVSGTENMLTAVNDGAVNLFYDNTLVLSTTADGISVTSEVEASEFIGDLRGAVLFKAQAGEALSKGDVVYISGISGNTTVVSKADADDASKMPAFGIAAAAANANASVDIYTGGILGSLDTSSYSEGDELFVSTTAGALTATAPTGETAAIQKIAKVTRSDASAGSIFIIGAGRTNAVPNLDQDQFFLGNASNQAVATDFSDAVEALSINNVVEDTTPQLGGDLDLNSSDITGTGNINVTGDITLGDINPTITFNDSSVTNLSHTISSASDNLKIQVDANGVDTGSRVEIFDGTTEVARFEAGAVDVTGNIVVSGTVDGRDLATDGTKLDGIEANATADQTQSEINALGITATGLSGTPDISVGTISSGNITTTGYLRGPATFTIDPATHANNTGTVVIAGNLQVDGTTTTINSTTLTVDDKNITLASGSTNAAAANGAGITVDCGSDTDATFTYDGTNDEWDFNKNINVTGTVTSSSSVISPTLASPDGTGIIGLSNTGDATFYRGAVFNENSHDSDFRVESNNNTHMLFVDAGNDRVGIGTDSPSSDLETFGSTGIKTGNSSGTGIFKADGGSTKVGSFSNHRFDLVTNNTRAASIDTSGNFGIGTDSPDTKLEIEANDSTNNGLTSLLTLSHTTTGTAADGIGTRIIFNSEDDGGTKSTMGYIDTLFTDVSDGAEKSAIQFYTRSGGSIARQMHIDSTGVGIGTNSPTSNLTVQSTTNINSSGNYTNKIAPVAIGDVDGVDNSRVLLVDSNQIETIGDGLYLNHTSSQKILMGTGGGNVGVGNTNPSAKFQVEEYGIDTTETSTTATTQVAIHTFAAATFRSARFTIQVTNSTDSTYHLTEVLMIHDGTTPSITEYGTIFTGAAAEATFDADISSGNVRLLATPASTDTMEFKVVSHSITA